jgi:hypothetical protein
MEPIWLALIVIGGGLATTIATALVNAWVISRSKSEDYARQDQVAARLTKRQDEVAEQAAEAAKLLLNAQRASVIRTDEVARLAAESDARTAEKLEAIAVQGTIIHSLVNQKLTTVTEQALAATLALLSHLETAIARTRAGGIEPTAIDLKRLADTRRSIVDLEATLAHRAEQQAEVDADAERGGLS